VQRVSIVGNSGSGKTTLAKKLAATLDVEHIELDAINHQPGWQALPTDEFRRRVAARLEAATAGWVVCGNYHDVVAAVVWPRADTVVWLDFGRPAVMRRIVVRTLRRVATREELWNGNRESWRNLWAWDPERNIVRWAWTQHRAYVERYEGAADDPSWAKLTFVRLLSPAQADRWLAAVTRP